MCTVSMLCWLFLIAYVVDVEGDAGLLSPVCDYKNGYFKENCHFPVMLKNLLIL